LKLKKNHNKERDCALDVLCTKIYNQPFFIKDSTSTVIKY